MLNTDALLFQLNRTVVGCNAAVERSDTEAVFAVDFNNAVVGHRRILEVKLRILSVAANRNHAVSANTAVNNNRFVVDQNAVANGEHAGVAAVDGFALVARVRNADFDISVVCRGGVGVRTHSDNAAQPLQKQVVAVAVRCCIIAVVSGK